MCAALIANQQRIALSVIACAICSGQRLYEAPISILAMTSRYAFGDYRTFCVLSNMNHFGSGISLLIIIRDRD
jgi:hypothetical protein